MRQDIIITIRHEFAEKINSGEKTYELRKRQPNVIVKTRCWIYEPAPVGRITGFFFYGGCLKEEKEKILNNLEDNLGLPSRKFFYDYYGKEKYAYAWKILNPERLDEPLTLGQLGLQKAPQSYIFLNGETLTSLIIQKQKIMTEEQRKQIAQMYNDGWNPEDIAEELGLDEVKVIDYCSELLRE